MVSQHASPSTHAPSVRFRLHHPTFSNLLISPAASPEMIGSECEASSALAIDPWAIAQG